jgi:hypothetical protein
VHINHDVDVFLFSRLVCVYTATFADGIAVCHDSALWDVVHLMASELFVSPHSMWVEDCIILVVAGICFFQERMFVRVRSPVLALLKKIFDFSNSTLYSFIWRCNLQKSLYTWKHFSAHIYYGFPLRSCVESHRHVQILF